MGFTNYTIEHAQFEFIMNMLNQYKDPYRAVLREYVSNAMDAVQGVRTPRVTVTIPSDAGELVIQDNGTGMSSEFMGTTLNSYAASTKRDDKDSIGSKGIGSKSAFSLADRFTIESVHDGEHTTAVNDKQQGGMSIQSETGVNTGNGTIIRIPVTGEQAQCLMESVDCLDGFDAGILTVQESSPDGTVHDIPMRFLNGSTTITVPVANGISLAFNEGNGREWDGTIIINQAGVVYRNVEFINYFLRATRKFANFSTGYKWDSTIDDKYHILFRNSRLDEFTRIGVKNHLVISLPANTLELTPSRENIVLNDRNVDAIMDVFINVLRQAIGTPSNDMEQDSTKVNDFLRDKILGSLSNKGYNDIPWGIANKVWQCVNKILADSEFNIGDTVFNPSIVIEQEPETVVYSRYSGNVSSRYTPVHNYPCTILPQARYNNPDGVLLFTDVPVKVMNDGDLFKSRRLFMEEKGINPRDVDYAVFTTKSKSEFLSNHWTARNPLWKGMFAYHDIEDTLQARRERLKKARAATKGTRNILDKTQTVSSYNGSCLSRVPLTRVESYARDRVLRLEPVVYKAMTAGTGLSYDIIEKKMNLTDHGDFFSYHHGKYSNGFLVVKHDGSKKTKAFIEEHSITIDELDKLALDRAKQEAPKKIQAAYLDEILTMKNISMSKYLNDTYKRYAASDLFTLLGQELKARHVTVNDNTTMARLQAIIDYFSLPNSTRSLHIDDDLVGFMRNCYAIGLEREDIPELAPDSPIMAMFNEEVGGFSDAIDVMFNRYPLLVKCITQASEKPEELVQDIVDYINAMDTVRSLKNQ